MQPLLDPFDGAWSLAGGGDGYTIPSTGPSARIDYVLVSPHIEVERAIVPSSLGSDHLPLVTELELPRSQGVRSGLSP
jgi:endonuclease/exonuclease/phosphatase family metal-dependent hydrolase